MSIDERRNNTVHNRNLAVSLFGLLTFGALLILAVAKPQTGAPISCEAKSPSNLDGQIHRADSIFERDDRVVSRISQNAVQQPKAAELHVRTLLTGAPL